MAEDVDVRVGQRPHHTFSHALGVLAQLRVHGRHDHVQFGQQVFLLIDLAVQENVDLDAGENPEWRQSAR